MSRWFKFLKRKDKQSALYFAHIPKTAGTSFIVLLDRFYHANKIFPYQLWREVGDINLKSNQQYSLYRGHFGGGGVDLLTKHQLSYLTILRHPNALALSTYQFVKREANTKFHQLVINNDLGFKEFLQHPMTTPLIKNRMVRNLSFDFKQDPAAQEVFLSAETIEYIQAIIKKPAKPVSEVARLARAKQFLKKCQWFGVLERFDESLQLLCFVMHWPPMGQTQKLNTHSNRLLLDEKTEKLLSEINQQDHVLYNDSLKIFDQKLDQMKLDLEKFRTEDQQNIDDLLDLAYQSHHSQSKPLEESGLIKYKFDDRLLGSQWHRREWMEPEHEYFRWTGPGNRATIDFWLQPKSYEVSIRVINATSIEMLDSLKVTINDHEIEWQSSEQGIVRVVSLTCPASLIADNGLARLALNCQTMISHQQAFDSDDERLVGVAVHWIQFKHEQP